MNEITGSINTNHFKKFYVLSSNGKDFYEVILYENKFKCNCKGAIFRKTCRHIQSIKELLLQQLNIHKAQELVSKNTPEYIKNIILNA